MNVEEVWPVRYYINLGKREDRRLATVAQFEMHGLRVLRLAAVNARVVNNERGMATKSRYACGLSKRLAIRQAIMERARGVLIFEDDVVFHTEFRERIRNIELPEDWGMFYLGCQHLVTPSLVGPGIVRVSEAVDNHAIAINGKYLKDCLRVMKPLGKLEEGRLPHSDKLLCRLQKVIPTYAAYPNLIWQRCNYSDNTRCLNENYTIGGNQINRAVLEPLNLEIAYRGYPLPSDCKDVVLAAFPR